MNKDHIKSFQELFDLIYKGDSDAIWMSFKLLEVAHTWDDLVDKDKELSEQQINSAFVASIFELSNNKLWFPCGLNHHVLNVFLRWQDSNWIEKNFTDDNELAKAWMLRAGIYDIFVVLAYHLYGLEWAAEIGPIVRQYYGEKLPDFLKEVKDA